MILLLEHLPEQIDMRALLQLVRMSDPEGQWELKPSGTGAAGFHGRGCHIGLSAADRPVEGPDFALALRRSFWFGGGESAIGRHRAQVLVETDIDTARADWVSVRQTAKVVTFLAAHLAQNCATTALYNEALGTLFGTDNCRDALEVLSRGKLPISLWTWTVPHSLADGDVTLATLGLEAFVGHEVETWHAAFPAAEAQRRFSGILAYLLEEGPAIRDGDIIGALGADKATLCRMADSRLPRGRQTPALMVEFDVPKTTATSVARAETSFAEAFDLGGDDHFDFSGFQSNAA